MSNKNNNYLKNYNKNILKLNKFQYKHNIIYHKILKIINIK